MPYTAYVMLLSWVITCRTVITSFTIPNCPVLHINNLNVQDFKERFNDIFKC